MAAIDPSASYHVVKNQDLVKKAAESAPGRQFWTGGRLEGALEHLKAHPNDVCMVRHDGLIVLLGGPIHRGTLVDVTEHDFSNIADSFDVGEMTSLVEQWFKKDFDKQGKRGYGDDLLCVLLVKLFLISIYLFSFSSSHSFRQNFGERRNDSRVGPQFQTNKLVQEDSCAFGYGCH